MNREIKFRAWVKDKDGPFMVYQGDPDIETLQSFVYHYGDRKLMQFTGLHDKNGKEIYEGDLVTNDKLIKGTALEVIWSKKNCCFLVKDKSGWDDYLYANMKNCEVIGNVYEGV